METAANQIAITVDVDWAPEPAIAWLANHLIERQVRSTWFVTHPSEQIERLRTRPDLFELGIHPNFLPGSTQGDSPAAVLDYCRQLVPEATCVRTHRLVQSTPLLTQIMRLGYIRADVSLFLPATPHLRPVPVSLEGYTLWRIPYLWEDDYEMHSHAPCWDLARHLQIGEGLKVFNFHPVHVYLNSADLAPYEALKQRETPLAKTSAAEMRDHIYSGAGTRNLLEELVAYLAAGPRSYCIRDLWSPAEDL
jgi:hypothetical protein